MEISIFDDLIKKIDEKNIQIVLLGESAHGIKEQNQVRIELIKRLNQELGFNTIYIESLSEQDGKLAEQDAKTFLKEELHSVYHTTEILDFLSYLKESAMELKGFELSGNDLAVYKSIKDKSTNEGWDSRSFRDQAMFESFNLQYKQNTSKKVIIWGHNTHLSKKTSSGAYRDVVFGHFLNEYYGDISLAVAQFTASGTVEHMPGQKRVIPEIFGSLETYIMSKVKDIDIVLDLYKDFSQKEVFHSFCCGKAIELIYLPECFDALILHRHGSVPSRI